MRKPVVAVVGAGHMGASHARVVTESDRADLGVVVDTDVGVAEAVAARHWARASPHLDDALAADAVVVAASTSAHLECALAFLEAGIPTLVEKPLAPALPDVDHLLKVAAERDVPLMCGFVERFNAAITTVSAMLVEPPVHLISLRHAPPAPHISSSVVPDILLHDLDLAVQLFGATRAEVVAAACHRPPTSRFHEVADCTLRFPSGQATLSANRMGQRKTRSMIVHGIDQTFEIDLLRQDVAVYRNVSQEIVREGGGIGYRASTEIDIPFVRHTGEPLALQFAHFMDLVTGSADHRVERDRIRTPHRLMHEIEFGSCQE